MRAGSRTLTLIIGVLLVLLGIYLMSFPVESATVLSYFFLGAMLVFGIAKIVYYAVNRQWLGAPWLTLFSGVLSVVLSIVLMFTSPLAVVQTLTVLYTLWLIVTSAIEIAYALLARKFRAPNWGLTLCLGIFGVLLGLYVLIHPFTGVIVIGIAWPILIVMRGITNIGLFFAMKQ